MAKVQYSIRIEAEVKKKLEKEAAKQNRTVANLIDTILTDYINKKK